VSAVGSKGTYFDPERSLLNRPVTLQSGSVSRPCSGRLGDRVLLAPLPATPVGRIWAVPLAARKPTAKDSPPQRSVEYCRGEAGWIKKAVQNGKRIRQIRIALNTDCVGQAQTKGILTFGTARKLERTNFKGPCQGRIGVVAQAFRYHPAHPVCSPVSPS
jgi:hypothetical protein